MKIFVRGATGRTGKWVLQKALAQGYEVNILVRDKNKVLPNKNLVIFEGTPGDRFKLKESARDCEALISVLNISRTSDFPWAKLRTPQTFLSDVMKSLVKISKKLGIKRIVVCSAWGVNETFGDLPFWFQWMIKYSKIGVAYKDHGRQEDILKGSYVDCTIVRPLGLTNSEKSEKIGVSYNNHQKPNLIVSRKSVAHFMVEAIQDKALIGKNPVIFMI